MTRLAPFTLALALAALAGCHSEKTCAVGQTLCGGRCTSVEIDSSNCGACGARCGAYEECNAGACECGPGTIVCAGAGNEARPACVDPTSDPANCAGCGTACGAGQVCATSGDATACAGACPAGQTACAGGCVDLRSSRWSCGACGARCDRGESCRDGACRPDLLVACFSTDEVRPVDAALRSGLPRAAGDGPVALAATAQGAWAAASLSHSVVAFPVDLSREGHEVFLGGSDLEAIAAHGGRLYASNVGSGSLVVLDAATLRVVDEVVLGPSAGLNPRSVAFVGDRAWVALYGTDASSGGQELVEVDLSGAAGAVVARVSLASAADLPGLPFPSHVVAVGAKVYATLANLKLGSSGYYTDPAGHGKLAVVDTAAGNALAVVDLGAGCTNAGGLAVDRATLWVACGGTGNLQPVDLSTPAPAVGAPLAAGVFAPGSVAFCGGIGYVTDQWSGSVASFDPSGAGAAHAAEVCPLDRPAADGGWAWASDVACAP